MSEKGVPMCSLFGHGKNVSTMTYGGLQSSGFIDWDSWDIFIQKLVEDSLSVKKAGSVFPLKMKYERGSLVLSTLFMKKLVVCVRGVKSCTCIGNTIVVDTEEAGYIRLSFSTQKDALAIARVLSGFACGLYTNN